MVYRSLFWAESSSGSRLFLFMFLLLVIQNLCTTKEIPTENINKDEDDPALEVFEDLEGRQKRSLDIELDIGKERSGSLEKIDSRSQAIPEKRDSKGRSEINIVIVNVDGSPKKCPKNQKYYECKPICNTCEFYGKNIQCNTQCVDGCFCDEEHVMTKDGQCVKPGECGKKAVICPPHSVYKENGPLCESCGRRCLALSGKPNCYCEKGYGRQNAADICTKCPWLRN